MKTKNRKIFFGIFLIFLLVSLMNLSSGAIVPDSHDEMGHEAVNLAPDSTYGKIVKEHFDDFSACMSLTDYSVFFYFQQGFSTIGKIYLASHNNLICSRAIELADKNNPAQMACAIGICGMDAMDSSFHNGFVPMMIDRIGLPNGILHAPSEECVNKKISTPALLSEGKSALVNKYPVHKEFLIKVFQADERTSKIQVGVMMDAFVAEVANSKEYTVGFRGFTAVPTSIHLIMLLIFLMSILLLAFLIRIKSKTLFNKISIGLTMIPILLVILIYILYFTGHIWQAFQVATTPYCWVAPIDGYQSYVNQAVQNMVQVFNYGGQAVFNMPDPSGMQALHDADQSTVWKLWVIGTVLVGLIALFIWLNFRKKKS